MRLFSMNRETNRKQKEIFFAEKKKAKEKEKERDRKYHHEWRLRRKGAQDAND